MKMKDERTGEIYPLKLAASTSPKKSGEARANITKSAKYLQELVARSHKVGAALSDGLAGDFLFFPSEKYPGVLQVDFSVGEHIRVCGLYYVNPETNEIDLLEKLHVSFDEN